MNYSYMKHHYGDNCFYGDTSYKRYARYHMPRASVNIFNVGGGGCYNAHQCCGGWLSGGNFWSGLGLGLGTGLGNMLMGGLNMLGGWLGGMGFGMPSFGYGNYGGGYMTPFGLGTSASDGSHRRKARKDDSDLEPQTVNDGKKTEDADYEEINKLMDISSLPEVDLYNEASVNAYNKAIDDAIKALSDYKQKDEISKEDNTTQIDKAKAMLEEMRVECIDPNTIAEEGYTLQVNNKFVTINDVNDLNDDVMDAIGDDKKKALAVLAAIGELRDDNMSPDFDNYHDDPNKTMHYVCGRLSTNYFVMKLYEKANIAVEVLKGNNSNGIKDHWYVGTVSDVSSDGSFSFELNCKDNGIARGTYRVTIDADNKAKIEQQGENGSWITINSGTEYDELNRLLKAGPKTTQQQ